MRANGRTAFALWLILGATGLSESGQARQDETAGPQPAGAAADPAGHNEHEGHALDTVVVTASPLDTTRFDVLQGTSVLTGEELDFRLESTLGETLRHEPGVSSTFFGQGASRPVIRGLGGDRVRVLKRGIGALDASVTSTDHAVAIDPLTAHSVEVIRGPATLLYGNSAAGGVVNVIDGTIPFELPQQAVEAAARGSYGTVDDGVAVAGTADGTLSSFVLHADGFYRNTDDYDIPGFARSDVLREAEPPAPGEEEPRDTLPNSDVRSNGGSVGLSRIFDGGFLGASVTFFNTNYGVPGVEEEEEEALPGLAPDEPGIRIDLEQFRADVAGEIERDFLIFERARLRFGYGDYLHRELEGAEVGTSFFNEGWEGRLELVQAPAGALTGALGLQLRNRDFAAEGAEAFVPPNTTFQWGLFALEEMSFGPWTASLGGRFERTDMETDAQPDDLHFNSVSVSGGLSWQRGDTVRVGLFGYRTERAPAPEELFSNGPHLATGAFEIGDPSLSEETATGVEGTVKYQSGRVAVGVNAYYTSYTDFIAEIPTGEEEDGLPVFRFTATEAEFYGAELESRFLVYENEEFSVSADLIADMVRATDAAGNNLPRIPPFRLLTGIEASSTFVDGRVEVQWVDEQDEIAPFELPTDGYTELNASLAFRPLRERDNVVIEIRGSNLTNEEIRLHTSFLKDLVPLPGRSVRIALKLRN